MCVRFLGLLLVWVPGVLHAQSTSCSAPTLDGGFFAPKQETYLDGTKLSYTCRDGRKPVVSGWWAVSICQNGQWSHDPQCIDETSCLPPTIPNAVINVNPKGWYDDGSKKFIKCLEGYEHKDRHATALCENGSWSSLPVCQRSMESCSEPPKMSHAVIIDMKSQEVFATNSELLYECEDGFTTEGTEEKKIYCIYGNWTEGKPCIRKSTPGPGSTEGGAGTTSTTGSTERETGTSFVPIDKCGRYPVVENAVITETERLYLRYTCNDFYTLVGPKKVACYRDGTWSKVPFCRDTSCSVDTSQYRDLKPDGVKLIKDGESVRLACVDKFYFESFSEFTCDNGRVESTRCCNRAQLNLGIC